MMEVNSVKNTDGIPIPAKTIDMYDNTYDSCLYENESLIDGCIDRQKCQKLDTSYKQGCVGSEKKKGHQSDKIHFAGRIHSRMVRKGCYS